MPMMCRDESDAKRRLRRRFALPAIAAEIFPASLAAG